MINNILLFLVHKWVAKVLKNRRCSEKPSDLLKCTKAVCGRDSKSAQLSHVALLWSEVQDHFAWFWTF